VENGLTHCFGRNGACVDAGSANDLAHFNKSDFFAHLCAVNGSALACGAGTNDDEVVNSAHRRREVSKSEVQATALPGAAVFYHKPFV